MKRVMVFMGSPNATGSTMKTFEYVVQKLKESRIEVSEVEYDTTKPIQPCIDCGCCWKNNGLCPMDDQYKQAIEELGRCSHLIIMSPIYHFSFNAQTKAFIDRISCRIAGKKVAVITVSGSKGRLGGADIVYDIMRREEEWYKGDGFELIGCYNRVTNDMVTDLTHSDKMEIDSILGRIINDGT